MRKHPDTGRFQPLWEIVALSYKRDPWRTTMALIPVFPLFSGAIALSGRDILTLGLHQGTRVIAPAVIGGVALIAAAVVGYWQAANGLLRLMQITSSELDFAILGRLSDTATIEVYDDPRFVDRLEMLRIGRSPLVNILALLGGVIGLLAGTAVTAVLFAAVDPWLALLPLLAVPIIVIYARTEAASGRAEEAVAENRRVALHLYDVGTGPSEGKELRALGQTQTLLQRHTTTWDTVNAELIAADHHALKLRIAAWTGYSAVTAAVFGLVLTTTDRHVSGPSLFLLTMAATQLTMLSSNGAATVAGLRNAADLAGHYGEVVAATKLEPRTGPGSNSEPGQPAGSVPAALSEGIRLNGVRLCYPGSDSDALGPIDLHLPAGSVTAIVGPNGAGKTTLVNLLLGLRRPTGGSITIDSRPLADVHLPDWQARTSVVCQDFTRFELSARESVAVGDLLQLGDDEAAWRALNAAEAGGFLEALPDGLDTMLGPRFGGRELSGGQWQRIALARGLMRPAPLLLVLDEPTVSIDAVTEQRLLERCVSNARALADVAGTIVVFVSHRYATTRLADQILMVEGGQIAERGTHAELLGLDERYSDIYRAQEAAYRR
jgi:ATP-binding cassette subfamily B protein